MVNTAVLVEPGTIARLVIDPETKRSVWSSEELKFDDDLSQIVSSGCGRIKRYKAQPDFNSPHCVGRHDEQNVQVVLSGGLFVRGRDGAEGGEERYFGPGAIVDYGDVLYQSDFLEGVSGHQRRNEEETVVLLIWQLAPERAD